MRTSKLALAVLLVLLLAPAAFAGLSAVGPVVPDADGNPLTAPWNPPFQLGAPTGYNGFPQWYRDSLGQTVVLAPQDPLTIWDPVIAGNAFSAQIQFGSEGMYWTGDATIPTATGSADLIMALESAFNTGDAAPGEQIVFGRIRIRIDTTIAGTYTVFYPYGTKTFTAAAGVRAINFTSDIGIGAPGDFTGALSGEIGPFLRQVTGAPAGYLGNGTFGEVTGSPIPSGLHISGFQNFFRVEGPPGFPPIQTNAIAVTGKLFNGTPYNVTRSTYNRSPAGVFADVFVTIPQPVPAGVGLSARRPDQAAGTGVFMTRNSNLFYARVNYPNGLPPNPTVICTGTTPGFTPTVQVKPLVDAITITKAQATRIQGRGLTFYNLTIEAVSSDSEAALTAEGWNSGKLAMRPPVAQGSPWTLTILGLRIPPRTVTVQSTTGSKEENNVMIVTP